MKTRTIKILLLIFILSGYRCFSAELVDYVVASINGEPVTLLDLKSSMSMILERDNWDGLGREEKAKVLNEVINRKLLLSEAEKIGITAEDREIELSISDVLKSRLITRGELEEELKTRGVSWAEYTAEIRFQILKEKVMQKVIFPKIQE